MDEAHRLSRSHPRSRDLATGEIQPLVATDQKHRSQWHPPFIEER